MSSSKIPYLKRTVSSGNIVTDPEVKLNASNASSSTVELPDSYLDDRGSSNNSSFGQGTKPLKPEDIKNSLKSTNYNKDLITTYGTKTMAEIMDKIHTSIHLPDNNTSSFQNILINDSTYYNRFKAANPNIGLTRGFSHIFFVNPSCNILQSNGELVSQFDGNALFEYAKKEAPQLLDQLSEVNSRNNDFMMLLSNYVSNFSLTDEYIGTDTYGKGYTGYKIAYGKHNIESKTANSISVSFYDDRNLHIYQLHRLWVEYISGCYRGQFSPTMDNIVKKILDYAGAIYYFLTAEDNETILFWIKYYGVFPSTIPSTGYSYSKGQPINNPEVSIDYQYSFKKEFDPYIFTEFNYNSSDAVRGSTSGVTYVPTYDKRVGSVGKTYVGSPYVELVQTDSGRYEYKLRFTES